MMTFGRFRQSTDLFEPMAEINVTPLVDVTLVLLVVFIIAAPLLTYAIKLDLPAAQAAPAGPAPAAIDVSIDAAGTLYWNGTALDVRYEFVAQLMSAAQRAGVQHIGFVTDPAASTGWPRSGQH
jgi:biopolymer transport protein ExbD